MKYIKKSIKAISMFLTGLILFLNCTNYTTNFNTHLLPNLTGEEIFKSIFLMDGDLTKKINGLSRYSVVDKLSNEELIQYRQEGKDLIAYLSSKDQDYFDDFQNKLYSQDPVLIKETLLKVTQDIEPWLVNKLNANSIVINKEVGLSDQAINIIENGFSNNGDFQDANLQKEISKNYSYEMDQKCGIAIAVIGVVLVAAIAVAVYLWAWVWTPDKKGFANKDRITKDVIAIQIAENLRLN